MNEQKYLNDLKNLQPRPLDPIPVGSRQSANGSQQLAKVNHRSAIINHESKPINQQSEKKMEPLKTSKTMWGFGIAVFIYILQSLLVAFNITSPDNLILKTFIEVVIAVSGFFGVYGVRDALRKMSL